MSLPEVVTDEKWESARRELLANEKQLTKVRDHLNTERRQLPTVEVTKAYEFEGPNGSVSLLDEGAVRVARAVEG